MSPEKLMELADRIDHEQLWRRSWLARETMTQEQTDRLDAGVMLRRYADLLGGNCWRIYPPRPNVSFRAATLDKVVEMVRRDEARRTDPVSQPAPAHSDDIAVDRFAIVMKNKLALKRSQGRTGWEDPDQCSVELLSRMLVEHVHKGDPVDIGNFAMMLHQRGCDWKVLKSAFEYHVVENWDLSVLAKTPAPLPELSQDEINDALEAAQALETEARSTFECHTVSGQWGSDEVSIAAKDDHDRFQRLATSLRAMAGEGEA